MTRDLIPPGETLEGSTTEWGICQICGVRHDPRQECSPIVITREDLTADLPESLRGQPATGVSYETHDSGQRQEYSTGMRRDLQDGKPRFDLVVPKDLPFDAQMLTRWAALMERGAVKYGPRNWELACTQEELDRFLQSAFRHFMQWFMGVDDGEDHAAATYFNVQCAEYVRYKMEDGNDNS